MSSPASSESAVNAALRRTHRGVLWLLAACAAAIALTPTDAGTSPAADLPRTYAYAASGLGIASILTRRRRVPTTPEEARRHVHLSLASLLSAGGVGLVGVAAVAGGAPRSTALIYALAGAIFALRPPPALVAPTTADSA